MTSGGVDGGLPTKRAGTAQFFDAAYEATDRYWWREEHRYSLDPTDHPTSLLTQLMLREVGDRPGGRMLDVGGGEGTDAIRLALAGWDVTMIDVSAVACAKAREFAHGAGVTVRVLQGDVISLSELSLGRFDLVVCNGVLHYVQDKKFALAQIQDATVQGGINVISSWTSYTPVPEEHKVIPCFPDSERGQIFEAYRHWEDLFLYFERGKQESSHSDFGPHIHSFIKLIAKRPV